MKHLFFVSVAAGIFSGTSLSAQAQITAKPAKSGTTPTQAKSVKFIDDIEIKHDASSSTLRNNEKGELWTLPSKKTTEPVVISQTNAEVDLWNEKPQKMTEPLVIEDADAKSAINLTEASAAKSPSTITLQFKYAQLMDVNVETITNIKLYKTIEEWWATSYRYGGTSKKGIDCSALTGTILKDVYGITPDRTARAQYAQSKKISRDNLQEGDLVFFNTTGGVSHVGIYLGNGYFVHSSVHKGVTISSLDDSYYSRKYIGGGRL